jgi:hypothetical protein
MIRRLGRFLKPLILALLALVLLPCALEVWLRWQEFRVGRPLFTSDEAASPVAPSWFTYQQLKPLRHIITRNPDTLETFETQTNSFGLRGAEPLIPKSKETIRVVVLGDETILGLEVSDEEVLTARLQAKLATLWKRPVEVLNAGVPGDCPLTMSLRLKHDLATLQPDLVICHFDMSDVADDYSLRRRTVFGPGDEPLACPHPLLEHPVRGVGQRLGDQFLLIRWGERLLQRHLEQPHGEGFREEIAHPLAKYAWLADNPPDWSPQIQLAFSALSDVHQAASVLSARLLIATCPAPWQVSAQASHGRGVRAACGVADDAFYASDLPFRLLRDFTQQRHLVLCDTSTAFRQASEPERLFLTNAPRLSAAGHELYANTLARFLAEQAHTIPPPDVTARRAGVSELR